MKIRDTFKKHYIIIILIVLGLSALLWWKPGYLIVKGEAGGIWFNPLGTLSQHIFLWEKDFGGQISPWPLLLANEFAWFLLLSLNIPLAETQIIFYLVLFILSGLAMYYLGCTLYKSKIVGLIAGILWMFNFYRIPFVMQHSLHIIFAFLPFLVAFFINIQRQALKNKLPLKEIVCFAVIFMVFNSMLFYPPYSIMTVLVLLGIFLGYVFLALSRDIKLLPMRLFKANLIFLIITVLVSSWFLVAGYFFYFQTLPLVPDIENPLEYIRGSQGLLSLFRLSTSNAWAKDGFSPSGIWWASYHPFPNIEPKSVLASFLFLFSILSFSHLLIKKEKNDFYLVIGAAILLFLAKGINPPLGKMSENLWILFPIKFIRQPADTFIVPLMLCFSLLLGSLTQKITQIKILNTPKLKIIKYFCMASMPLLCLFLAFPLLSGNVLPGRSKETSGFYSSYVKVPHYWQEMADYINNKTGEFKVLVLPIHPEPNEYFERYRWGFFGTKRIAEDLIEKPVVDLKTGYFSYNEYNNIVLELLKSIENNDQKKSSEIINALKIKYVLFRKDMLAPPNMQVASKLFLQDQKNSLSFNGIGDYVESPEVNPKDQLTLEAWIKPNSLPLDGVILSKSDASTKEAWELSLRDKGLLRFSGVIGNKRYDRSVSAPKIVKNVWQHVAVTYDGKKITIYRNSSPIDTIYDVAGTFMTNTGMNVMIGAKNQVKPQNFWDGNINEVRIYNRALSQDEIFYSFIAEAPMDSSDLILWLSLHETAKDMSGNGNDGVIYGATFVSEMLGPKISALEKSFGDLDLYRIKDEYLAPYIYGRNHLGTFNVSYLKVNPVKYFVKANSSAPFNLIFSEGYNSEWKIYAGNISWFEALYKKPINEVQHFLANDCVNGWHLKPENDVMTVYFYPQSLFYIGAIISLLTIGGGCLIFFWVKIKKSRLKIWQKQ